jgi:hypothetical protein
MPQRRQRVELLSELLVTAAQLDLEHFARLRGFACGQPAWQTTKAGLALIDPEHPGLAAVDSAV